MEAEKNSTKAPIKAATDGIITLSLTVCSVMPSSLSKDKLQHVSKSAEKASLCATEILCKSRVKNHAGTILSSPSHPEHHLLHRHTLRKIQQNHYNENQQTSEQLLSCWTINSRTIILPLASLNPIRPSELHLFLLYIMFISYTPAYLIFYYVLKLLILTVRVWHEEKVMVICVILWWEIPNALSMQVIAPFQRILILTQFLNDLF